MMQPRQWGWWVTVHVLEPLNISDRSKKCVHSLIKSKCRAGPWECCCVCVSMLCLCWGPLDVFFLLWMWQDKTGGEWSLTWIWNPRVGLWLEGFGQLGLGLCHWGSLLLFIWDFKKKLFDTLKKKSFLILDWMDEIATVSPSAGFWSEVTAATYYCSWGSANKLSKLW